MCHDDDGEQDRCQYGVVAKSRERDAEGCRLRNAGDPHRPAGHALPFDRDILDDQPECDGDHREINTAHAHRRICKQRPEQARDDYGRDAGANEIEAELRGQHGAGIGSKREQAGLAEGHEPGQADEYIQTHRDDRVDQKEHEKPQLVFVRRGQRNNHEKREEQYESDPGQPRAHTLNTSRFPNRPCG